jgi:selenide,water dikinase
LFTKALGTGVISTAIKRGTAKHSWIDAATHSMTTLNRIASEIIVKFCSAQKETTPNHVRTGSEPALSAAKGPVHAEQSSAGCPVHSLTDITGFGLIGHAREMALASNVSLQFRLHQTPLLEGALDCVRAGNIPGGLKNNRDFAECVVGYEEGIAEELKTMLFDPQTAGGLLISVAPEHAPELLRKLQAGGVPAVEIGEVLAKTRPLITVSD